MAALPAETYDAGGCSAPSRSSGAPGSLVGTVDAPADQKASVLWVHAIHDGIRFTRTTTKAVHAELGPNSLARAGYGERS